MLDLQALADRWRDYRQIAVGGEDAVERELTRAIPSPERRRQAQAVLVGAHPVFVPARPGESCPNCGLQGIGECICPDVRWTDGAPTIDTVEAAAALGVGLAWYVDTRTVLALGVDRLAAYAVAAYATRRYCATLRAHDGIVVYARMRCCPPGEPQIILAEALRLAPIQIHVASARQGVA
jgi:hypothetical protein